jgi:hypothetical protein
MVLAPDLPFWTDQDQFEIELWNASQGYKPPFPGRLVTVENVSRLLRQLKGKS